MSHNCRVCNIFFKPSEGALKKCNYICKPCRKIENSKVMTSRKERGLSISGSTMTSSYHKNYAIEYNARPEVKKRRLDSFNERMKNPENLYKEKARRKARGAIKSGKLVREPCEVCGEIKVDAHHDDYDNPLNVRWLCRKHHLELHRKAKARGDNNE